MQLYPHWILFPTHLCSFINMNIIPSHHKPKMASKPKSQDGYLYHGIWTAELDNLIVSSILREKQLHQFAGFVFPPEFLYDAEATIKEETDTRVNRDDVYNRLHFPEHRHQTFKSLVEHPNTRFEPSSN